MKKAMLYLTLSMSALSLFALSLVLSNAGAAGVTTSAHYIQINSTLSGYLAQYLPPSLVKSSYNYSEMVNGASYIIMQLNSSHVSYIVVNVTGGKYSIMLNSTDIYASLSPFLLNKYAPNQSAISTINSTIAAYRSDANPPIADCLQETGLNRLTVYPADNTSIMLACESVPNCERTLTQLGGMNTPFGSGMVQFNMQYHEMNHTYSNIFSLLSGVNSTNYGAKLGMVESNLSSIGTQAAALAQNPLFPLPSGFPVSQLAPCSSYSGNTGPWYCYSIGYCGYLAFNTSRMSQANLELNAILSEPVTPKNIMAVSENSSKIASSYVMPIIVKKNTTQLNNMLNFSYPEYNSIVTNATFLLGRFNNATLSNALGNFTRFFNSIISKGIYQNISVSSTNFNSMLSNLTGLYKLVGRNYYPALNLSKVNTALSLLKQIDYKHPPAQLTNLSKQESSLNAQLNGTFTSNSIAPLMAQLESLNSKINSFGGSPGAGSLVKSVDYGFLSALVSGSSASIPSKISSAPLYAALLSFIIALVLIGIFYFMTYYKLKKAKRIRKGKLVRRAWMLLFSVLFIVALLYAYVTFVAAAGANHFLPASLFISRMSHTSTAVIALNGSSQYSAPALACANSTKAVLLANGVKNVSIIRVQNYSCSVTLNSATYNGTSCYNKILSTATPMVQIEAGNSNYITYKGMYGAVLYASGNYTQGSSCALSTLFYAMRQN